LENVVERLVVLAVGDDITDADLPDEFRISPQQLDSFLLELPEEGISLEAVERELLVRALE
jgi:two-component system NtrC family response regulator